MVVCDYGVEDNDSNDDGDCQFGESRQNNALGDACVCVCVWARARVRA